ncbi:MAG TPA: hypothetical protein VEV21_05100 [Burkholderiales bacterium]|nr:hypothetical protein [Burkholderiales bacterium]
MLHFDIEPRRGYLYVTVTGQLDVAAAQAAHPARLPSERLMVVPA